MVTKTKILIGIGAIALMSGIYVLTRKKGNNVNGNVNVNVNDLTKTNHDLADATKPIFNLLSDLSFRKKDKDTELAQAEALDESLEEDEADEVDADNWHNASGLGRCQFPNEF